MRRAIRITGALTFLTILLAILLWPSPAHAGKYFHLGLDGVSVAGPHHWWTNDSSRTAYYLHMAQRIDRTLTPTHHHRADPVKAANRARKRLDKIKCGGYHSAYVLHHGFTTPRGLRGLTGCAKWKADAAFHHEAPGSIFPTIRSLIIEGVNHG